MKTKIVATIGPASSSYEMLRKLAETGVNVFRLNFSHGSYDEHQAVIENIRKVNADTGLNVSVLADLQGPKIRLGMVADAPFLINDGDIIEATTRECKCSPSQLYITYAFFASDVKPDEIILIDDGKIMLKVLESNKIDRVKLEVLKGGLVQSKKGVNMPETVTTVPSLTEKDLDDLDFILTQDVNWIALSFVRSAADIDLLRTEMLKRNKSSNIPGIVAKIEKPEAVNCIDEIVAVTDAVMVARGDLGVELPMEQVPLVQKHIVAQCIAASKPVIVATQMMESMIESMRPTRAEVNDVANSVMDGADAVMLSGETSVGKYPVLVVESMKRIILQAEQFSGLYDKHHSPRTGDSDRLVSDTILLSACHIARESAAKAIIAFTHSGYSAFRISSQRPYAGIFIFTENAYLANSLNLVWGVKAYHIKNILPSTSKTFKAITEILTDKKLVEKGDLLVNVASTPVYVSGKTNMLKLSYV